ncbi:ABC transporter ATP-binding protein [Candidatus Methylospira mobilis]|uniref:ABC transporter ATP-binding protein n=1 Tax=Candidatus Methylospira mobilis TaxID=1808979 RepID=UPI0028F14444|nr:ABC transporter ATP-binding protein [Candidatus Methylospira mobilis]WNV04620.1 ABC transporter ATP-binding protein [Candidatus Methylospira mobilis]
MLKVSRLSYSYGRKLALDDISFEVQSGRCTMLLGPNGAGKSTLFSLITHLYDSPQGQIEIAGYSLLQQPCQALAKLGVVFQQPTLDLDLSVLQNLRYHAALHGLPRAEADKRIQEMLERLNVSDRRLDKVRTLNGGHRRRVEIARALLHRPALLLLDEPSVGLDVPSRRAMVDHIHALAGDSHMGVLWATHLIDEVSDRDSLIVLHQGKVRAHGSVAGVLQATGSASLDAGFRALTEAAA